MIFNDTVTVYNRRFKTVFQPPKPPAQDAVFERTVIKGVMWRDRVQINPTPEGAAFVGQSVSVTIPVEADQSGKAYMSPPDFARLHQDDHSCWTLRTNESYPDIIVYGEAPEITEHYTEKQLMRDYKYMHPRAVSDSSNQSVLPQWKVV